MWIGKKLFVIYVLGGHEGASQKDAVGLMSVVCKVALKLVQRTVNGEETDCFALLASEHDKINKCVKEHANSDDEGSVDEESDTDITDRDADRSRSAKQPRRPAAACAQARNAPPITENSREAPLQPDVPQTIISSRGRAIQVRNYRRM